MDKVLVLHIFACFLMTGLIWIVQLVHYPSFKYVSETNFSDFSAFHKNSITLIVLPLMFLELGTSFFILEKSWKVINVVSVLILWISTFVFSVPCHNQLSQGKNLDIINKLVKTNWIRTIVWSLRSVGFLWILLNSQK